jgi:hypothetical protein
MLFARFGDQRHVLVSNGVANSIMKIDLQTMEVVDSYPAAGGPDCMDVGRDGKQILVTSRWIRKLTVIDLASHKVVRRVNVVKSPIASGRMHHAQRQMTMWRDNRNHLLDCVLVDVVVVVVAQLIGVAPGQFVAIVALTQLSESLQHANVRMWFGRIGERLWVSPRFHRVHHSIGIGHESLKKEQTVLGGHNFGALLPWWDMLLATVKLQPRYDPTGIRDQVEADRDYGSGFWSQQWVGRKRLFGRA